MKIVLDQKNFDRYGEDKYKKVKEFGFDGVSFAMCDPEKMWYTAPTAESDAFLCNERERAAKENVKIFCTHGPWYGPMADADEEGLKQKIAYTKRAIHNTAVLGVEHMVIHPFIPYGVNDIDKPVMPDTWRKNKEILTELAACAEKENVVLCLENMPMHNFSLAKPADAARMADEINSKNLMLCFDAGHVHVFPELNEEECLERVISRLRVVHAHDNFYQMDMHIYPFQGSTKWNVISKFLKEKNYDLAFEIEVSPSQKLPVELYEDTLRLLKNTADYIISLAD